MVSVDSCHMAGCAGDGGPRYGTPSLESSCRGRYRRSPARVSDGRMSSSVTRVAEPPSATSNVAARQPFQPANGGRARSPASDGDCGPGSRGSEALEGRPGHRRVDRRRERGSRDALIEGARCLSVDEARRQAVALEVHTKRPEVERRGPGSARRSRLPAWRSAAIDVRRGLPHLAMRDAERSRASLERPRASRREPTARGTARGSPRYSRGPRPECEVLRPHVGDLGPWLDVEPNAVLTDERVGQMDQGDPLSSCGPGRLAPQELAQVSMSWATYTRFG